MLFKLYAKVVETLCEKILSQVKYDQHAFQKGFQAPEGKRMLRTSIQKRNELQRATSMLTTILDTILSSRGTGDAEYSDLRTR